jgi:hypothetical protein
MIRRPRWMQQQWPAFSQDELSGLQEKSLIATYARVFAHLQPTP